MKVDFIIPGAMKCGTTTLANILKSHPEVEFCKKKEPQFFAHTDNWKNNLESYHNLYEQRKGVIYGEGSTNYTKYPDGSMNYSQFPEFNLELWDDIYDYNPEMKIIYLVRNPIDRIISQYMHVYERGFIDCSLEDALTKVPDLINTTRYYTQISPFINRFGKSNVLIVDFDDLVNDKLTTLKKVAGFLNIDFNKFNKETFNVWQNSSIGGYKSHHRFTNPSGVDYVLKRVLPAKLWNIYTRKKNNRGFTEKPQLSEKHRNIIRNMTRLDILALEKLMDKSLHSWVEG